MRADPTRSILTALFLFAPGCILNTAFPYNPRFTDSNGDGKAYFDGDCDEWPGHAGRPVIAGQGIYENLQEAVDAAKDGDVITVCPLPGTQEYGGLTVIEGKSISIVGGDDPDRIVLNGKDAGSTIRVADGSLTLENLTITGGTGTRYTADGSQEVLGGGIDAAFATGLTIENCIIEANGAQFGGGVFAPVLEGAETLILDSMITDNEGTSSGGGLYLSLGGQIIGSSVYRNRSANAGGLTVTSGTLTITASEIIANTASSNQGGGGALVLSARLNSEASEWGQGDTNNTPNDLMLTNSGGTRKSYNDKTSDETFSCDGSVPSCS